VAEAAADIREDERKDLAHRIIQRLGEALD
jgi:hypothetical protein